MAARAHPAGNGPKKGRVFGLGKGRVSTSGVSFKNAHIWYVSFSVYLARLPSLGDNSFRRVSFVLPWTCRLGSELGYRSVDDRSVDRRFPVWITPMATATFDRLMRDDEATVIRGALYRTNSKAPDEPPPSPRWGRGRSRRCVASEPSSRVWGTQSAPRQSRGCRSFVRRLTPRPSFCKAFRGSSAPCGGVRPCACLPSRGEHRSRWPKGRRRPAPFARLAAIDNTEGVP